MLCYLKTTENVNVFVNNIDKEGKAIGVMLDSC